jgi:tetratricopeptide (TPR) repeat protein
MPATDKNAEDFLSEVMLNPSEITFLCGAGISMPAPTRIPTVFTFYERLMHVAGVAADTTEVLWEKIRAARPQPRFEVFINQFKSIDTSLRFADVFNTTSYNSIHTYISENIRHGASGITTNFDECIELSSLGQISVVAYDGQDISVADKRAALYKPHGTISLNRHNLVITDEALSRTNNGFALLPNWRAALLNAINAKTLIVIGYSGSDDFDITPILAVSNPKQIIWIQHDGGTIAHSDTTGLCDRIIKALKGKRVRAIRGNFESFIQKIDKGVDPKLNASSLLDDILCSILNSADKKMAVERLLLRHFGCYKELLNAASNTSVCANARDYAYALFKLSRYNDCIDSVQSIDINDFSSIDDWHFINYYITSSLILVGRYLEASDRLNVEELNTANITDFRLLCDWRNLFAAAKYIIGDLDLAKSQYEIVLTDSHNQGYLEGFSTASWGIGDVLALKKEHDNAVNHYIKALDIAEALGKAAHCITLNRNIAEIYIDIGQYTLAKKYVVRSESILGDESERHNDFYLLFTKIKLSVVDGDEIGFAKLCERLLMLVNDGITTALLTELLVLLNVAHIDMGYNLESARYSDFLKNATEKIDDSHFLKIVKDPELVRLIFDPKLHRNLAPGLIASFRSIVFHSPTYLTS